MRAVHNNHHHHHHSEHYIMYVRLLLWDVQTRTEEGKKQLSSCLKRGNLRGDKYLGLELECGGCGRITGQVVPVILWFG